MVGDGSSASLDEALRLAELSGDERLRYLERNPSLRHPQVVVGYCRRAAGLLRMDLPLARRMVEAAGSVAKALDDPVSSARAERARAQLNHIEADYLAAQDGYSQAVKHYERAGEDVQAAITRSCALHVLALLGRFDRATRWAERSRELFDRMGDRVRLARLDANLAVVLHRRNEFEQALQLSLRAFERLRAQGTSQDVAVTLRNMLVCHVGLRNCSLAMDVYERARSFSERHRFPRLVLEADYTIAHVHHLKGETDRAMSLYDEVRRGFQDWGDPFHEALCDLDQSECHLDAGETATAEQLARRALGVFERLGVAQESGRALVHLAVLEAGEGRCDEGMARLDRATELFRASDDQEWLQIAEFYRALILERDGRLEQAVELSRSLTGACRKSDPVERRALLGSLQTHLALGAGGNREAREAASRAMLDLTALGGLPRMPKPPWLRTEDTAEQRLAATG